MYVVVCTNTCMYNFCICSGVIFACAQRSSVCVSMHESWIRIPSVDFKPGYWYQMCPELEYVVSGWRSVIAELLKVGSGASLICTCKYKAHTRDYACYCFVSRECGLAKSNR